MKKKPSVVRLATAVGLCVSLLIASIALGSSHVTAKAPTPFDDVETTEGAKQFDDAVREIEGILNLDLKTEKGVKQANSIIERNARKLAQIDKKAVHAAMRVSSFERGLKTEAARRKGGAEELAKELESNHETVATIAGVEDAARAIRESLKPAVDKLKRVSDALNKSVEASKKSARATRTHRSVANHATQPSEVLMNVTPTSFCGSYRHICNVLAALGAWYLWEKSKVLNYPAQTTACIVSGYNSWKGGCRNVSHIVLTALGCEAWFVTKVNACIQGMYYY